MEKLTIRARLYLSVIDDWKAPYEIAVLLGDTPPPSTNVVKSVLGRLISRGLVNYGRPNGTYRISEAGRAALAKEQSE